jgi:hypothetical protein
MLWTGYQGTIVFFVPVQDIHMETTYELWGVVAIALSSSSAVLASPSVGIG